MVRGKVKSSLSISNCEALTRRSQLEIHLEILDIVNHGVDKPSHILFKANLAWKPGSEFLAFLVGQGLLVELDSGRTRRYVITEKGVTVLGYFRKVSECLAMREVA